VKHEVTKQKASPTNARSNGNFLYLFIGLLFTLLALPFMDVMASMGRYSLTLLFSVFMLVGVWSLSGSRHVFRLGTLLVVAISVIAGFDVFKGYKVLEPIGLLLLLMFASLSCLIAARNVFVWHRADLNSLLGAFCVYLQLGLIWAVLYRLLHLYDRVAFSGNITGEGPQAFPDLVYFSFVTLASLGYGDITAAGGLARTFAYLEAVIGQFYLAVMVASLVGSFTSRKSRE